MVNDATNKGLPEGRLQRKMSIDGVYVATFRQIIMRHGLVMGAVNLLCLLLPGAIDTLIMDLDPLMSEPFAYIAILPVMLVFFVVFLVFNGHKVDVSQGAWLGYLWVISVVEELSFRLILPTLLLGPIGLIPAVVLSNLVFASIHFFTLRWKFINCSGAFLGGLALSRLLNNTEDIALVILVHWFFTFLNTPTSPKV